MADLLDKSGGIEFRDRSAIVGALGGAILLSLLGWLDARHRYQFRQLPEVWTVAARRNSLQEEVVTW